jgi:chromate transporter
VQNTTEALDSSNSKVAGGGATIPLWTLAWYFFLIALTTPQGAATHLRKEIVNKRKLLGEKEFYESFGLAEFMPQPDSSFGLSMHVGYRLRGPVGALVVAVSMVLPSFFIACILAFVYVSFKSIPWIAAMAAGAACGLCGVIAMTLLEISRKAIGGVWDLVLIFAAFLLLRYGILHISGVILCITPLALWLHAPFRHEMLPMRAGEPSGHTPTLGFRNRLPDALRGVFDHHRWGMVIAAFLLIGFMGTVLFVESHGPRLLQKLPGFSHSDSAESESSACPVAPLPDIEQVEWPVLQVYKELISSFSALSVCAIGGEETILPCLQRASVDHNRWMSSREFVDLFALSFIVPGPSMLAAFIGFKASAPYGTWSGLIGAGVGTLAIFLPNLAMLILVSTFWERLEKWKWKACISRSMLIIVSGALSAATLFVTQTTVTSPTAVLIALASLPLLLLSDINPVLIVLLCAVAGFFFLG